MTMDEFTVKTKDDFGGLSRSYVTHLLREARGHFDFTTDVALSLGIFDLEILLKFPVTPASMLFTAASCLHSQRVTLAASCLQPSGSMVISSWNRYRKPRRSIFPLWTRSESVTLNLSSLHCLSQTLLAFCFGRPLCPHVRCYCVVSNSYVSV